jgi:DNA processing protein
MFNILRLTRSNGVGPATFQKLIKYFGNCDNAIKNIAHFNTKKPVELINEDLIEKEIKETKKFGARILTYLDKDYPEQLKIINDFPPVITICGNINLLNRKSLAVIGSRNASANGCYWTKQFTKELGNYYIIISGMASGIDTFAHLGSLETGTIAVLGGGINNIYPKENEELYKNIQKQGLIISEQPFNSAPKAENFPSRNRIITALSSGVIVVEAGYKSGTLNTVRQAIEQGKEIMVCPGNPYDPRNEGSNQLIKDGAVVITNCDDVLYNLENVTKEYKKIEIGEMNKEQYLFGIKKDNDKSIDNIKNDNDCKNLDDYKIKPNLDDEAICKYIDYKNSTDLQKTILSKLNNTPIAIETLAEILNINVNTLNSTITEMELEGWVVVKRGKVERRK